MKIKKDIDIEKETVREERETKGRWRDGQKEGGKKK